MRKNTVFEEKNYLEIIFGEGTYEPIEESAVRKIERLPDKILFPIEQNKNEDEDKEVQDKNMV